MTYEWVRAWEPGNADVLSRVLRQHIQDLEAHPEFADVLEQHKADPSAHGLRELIASAIEEHERDKNAHLDLLLQRFSDWLEAHLADPNAHEGMDLPVKELIGRAIQKHALEPVHPGYELVNMLHILPEGKFPVREDFTDWLQGEDYFPVKPSEVLFSEEWDTLAVEGLAPPCYTAPNLSDYPCRVDEDPDNDYCANYYTNPPKWYVVWECDDLIIG